MAQDEAYRGWLRDADADPVLADDRSESFQSLSRRFSGSGKVEVSHGRASLRSWMPPILDQGDLQSCTAHALAGAMGFEHPGLKVSRLQLYYLSRSYEHEMHRDAGARLHNAIRALREHGAAPERDWPYDQAKATDRPSQRAQAHAQHYKISRYAPLAGGDEFRRCLKQGTRS